jgi:hypothetical protein
LRVEHVSPSLGCLFQTEIEFRSVERRLDVEPNGLVVAAVMPSEIADQRVLDREDRVAAEILVAAVENVRCDRVVAVS